VLANGACSRPSEKVADEPSGQPARSAVGHDAPMFGGTPQRNMVNLFARNMPADWNIKEDQRQNIKWVADLGKTSYGGPVVAGGKVFVGTNNERPRNPKVKGDRGVVMCFRESDGRFLWQAVHEKLPSGPDNDYPQQGIASTPAVEGNRLYYVSNRCELVCAATGGDGKEGARILWRLDMIKDLKVFPRNLANCSPLVAGDLVFVITGNGMDETHTLPSPEAPSFIAVHKKTGTLAWKSSLPGKNILDGQWSNPAYAVVNGKPQVIFPGGDGWLYGLEPKTGELIWKFDCNPKSSKYKPGGGGARNYILATPAVYDNKVYVGVGRDPGNEGAGAGNFWCVDITKTGDLSPVGDNFDPKAAVNKKSGLVWHYGGPAKDADRDYLFGRTLSTCAVHDGLVYVADLDSFVYCFDARTGEKYWEEDLKSAIWGSPLWVDGKVYLGSDDGMVTIFAAGKVKKQVGKVDMDEPVQSTPVVANGVLYVMTRSHLYAIGKK
jgi:outer membrane protein assembly factor BamB